MVQQGTSGATAPFGLTAWDEITTVAGGGAPGLYIQAYSVATDPNGNLYLTTGVQVDRVDLATGTMTTFAGGGTSAPGDGGPATQANIGPEGIAFDSSGNLFIADGANNSIRRVDAITGVISTIAGTGAQGFSGDGGLATQAVLDEPSALTVDPAGNIYFIDGNLRIRRIDGATGIITTFGGNGGPNTSIPADGTPATAIGMRCFTITTDAAGNVYCADSYFSGRIFRINAGSGAITTAVGERNSTVGTPNGDGGPALNATISQPSGMAFDADGNLYITDLYDSAIRRVDSATEIITTVAGPAYGFAGDGGPATSASLNAPIAAATDPAGNLYFSDSDNNRVRLIDFSTLASAQSIMFSPLPDISFPAAAFTLNATASSGLPVIYASNTPSVCVVSGSTVTILISGGCSITASQYGGGSYAAAVPVTQTFTVLFSDTSGLPANQAAAVDLLAQYGITSGCGNNDFCPNENVTRAEMAIFIVRGIFGDNTFPYSPTPYFADVAPDDFGFQWIQALYELGITKGCASNSDGTIDYCPNDSITRAQMAVFIVRARLGAQATFNYPAAPYFTDALPPGEDPTDVDFPYIQRMKMDGITSGCTATTYCPDDPVTRSEMALFIVRGLFNQLLSAGAPVITQISPSTLAVGAAGTFNITGANTMFIQGTSTLAPIPGVTIGTITVNSPTSLTVQLTAAANAEAGPRSIDAVTGAQEAVLPNGLMLQ